MDFNFRVFEFKHHLKKDPASQVGFEQVEEEVAAAIFFKSRDKKANMAELKQLTNCFDVLISLVGNHHAKLITPLLPSTYEKYDSELTSEKFLKHVQVLDHELTKFALGITKTASGHSEQMPDVEKVILPMSEELAKHLSGMNYVLRVLMHRNAKYETLARTPEQKTNNTDHDSTSPSSAYTTLYKTTLRHTIMVNNSILKWLVSLRGYYVSLFADAEKKSSVELRISYGSVNAASQPITVDDTVVCPSSKKDLLKVFSEVLATVRQLKKMPQHVTGAVGKEFDRRCMTMVKDCRREVADFQERVKQHVPSAAPSNKDSDDEFDDDSDFDFDDDDEEELELTPEEVNMMNVSVVMIRLAAHLVTKTGKFLQHTNTKVRAAIAATNSEGGGAASEGKDNNHVKTGDDNGKAGRDSAEIWMWEHVLQVSLEVVKWADEIGCGIAHPQNKDALKQCMRRAGESMFVLLDLLLKHPSFASDFAVVFPKRQIKNTPLSASSASSASSSSPSSLLQYVSEQLSGLALSETIGTSGIAPDENAGMMREWDSEMRLKISKCM